MAEKIVTNSLNYDTRNPNGYPGETNRKASETVPGQHLSLRELLTRFTRGQGVSIRNDVVEDFQADNIPDFSKMDKMELLEFKGRLADQLLLMNEQVKRNQSAKALKEEQEEVLRKQVEKRFQERYKQFVKLADKLESDKGENPE